MIQNCPSSTAESMQIFTRISVTLLFCVTCTETARHAVAWTTMVTAPTHDTPKLDYTVELVTLCSPQKQTYGTFECRNFSSARSACISAQEYSHFSLIDKGRIFVFKVPGKKAEFDGENYEN